MTEPHYAEHFQEFAAEPVTLGPMASDTWRRDPKRLGFMLARYKFVAHHMKGFGRVAEIGCGDGMGAVLVRDAVAYLSLYDFDDTFLAAAVKDHTGRVCQFDISGFNPLPADPYNGIYMLDVIEHIRPELEPKVMRNIVRSLKPDGVFIVGCPSLESQQYASSISRAGHVNCRNGDVLRDDMRKYFSNVFLFGMNDETLHTGFASMCHYLLAICTGPKR